MISVYVHENGETRRMDRIEPRWLDPASSVTFWVDLAAPAADEGRLLSDLFRFHPLAVEDAMSALQYPKIETYDGVLYLVLHGIDFRAAEHHFATHDIDFFLSRHFLVTVHDGRSRSITKLRDVCERHQHVLAEGPAALMHRIVDSMVDNYRPEIEKLEDRIEELEEMAFLGQENMVRQLLGLRRDLASMRRVLNPQRDAIGRLARREFPMITDEMAYRFRDVYDHVVRLADESILFQERVTGILEAHLSILSNRLNRVMKVLTVMSTIFLPLSVLTSLYGMNLALPHLPGGEPAQFWWILGLMASIAVAMLVAFRVKEWI